MGLNYGMPKLYERVEVNNRKNDKLSYRGVVYFYKEDESGNRVLLSRHNAGTLALAKLFAYSLIGENVSKLAPDSLNVYDSGGAPVLTSNKLLTARHVENNYQDLMVFNKELPYLNYRAYFECRLERTDIRAAAAIKAKQIVLLDKSGTTIASIELEGSEFAEIFEYNENLVIIWQMELIYDYLIEELPDEYK